MEQFAIIFGMLVVYFVNYGITFGQSQNWVDVIGWRYMFMTEAIPAVVFFVLLFWYQKPRYLILANKDKDALTVLNKIYSSNEYAKKY